MSTQIIAALIEAVPGCISAVITIYIWRRTLPQQTAEIKASARKDLATQTSEIKDHINAGQPSGPLPSEVTR